MALNEWTGYWGNSKLHDEIQAIYQSCAHYLLQHNQRPVIIVDWSHVPNTDNHVLRAALVGVGRALSLYEEVHPEKKLGNPAIQLHKEISDNTIMAMVKEC